MNKKLTWVSCPSYFKPKKKFGTFFWGLTWLTLVPAAILGLLATRGQPLYVVMRKTRFMLE